MLVIAPSETQEGVGPWMSAVVFLDMVRQEYCSYADDVEGTVKRYIPVPTDKWILRDAFGAPVEETVHGNVTIIERTYKNEY